MKKVLFGLGMLAFSGCKTNYEDLPAFSESKQVQVVIETPAGSAREYAFSSKTNEFAVVQEAGQDKIIRFLPYPANAGFIPSTRTPDNKPLFALVLSESQETGTVTEVMPVGVLLLESAGELEYQIVTVPAKPSERLLEATDSEEFIRKYPAAKKMLETWFLNSEPQNNVRIMGWKDDKFADELIRKHLK
ncbi:inorganic diphosphatase [Adhaeribacter sp. BT258]|uniref:inorganic diphosphatase n=1 Tax=Adhaeribacter terrigena TaxID=2793070 RepID=A0ABS1BXA7_9BACT|nr:inorganic diphosphatase [Adhaeribacter terrigena]MBK0401684.1 inorganic diphosphatase [Adhaeribacter terrigena]